MAKKGRKDQKHQLFEELNQVIDQYREEVDMVLFYLVDMKVIKSGWLLVHLVHETGGYYHYEDLMKKLNKASNKKTEDGKYNHKAYTKAWKRIRVWDWEYCINRIEEAKRDTISQIEQASGKTMDQIRREMEDSGWTMDKVEDGVEVLKEENKFQVGKSYYREGLYGGGVTMVVIKRTKDSVTFQYSSGKQETQPIKIQKGWENEDMESLLAWEYKGELGYWFPKEC